MGFCSLLANKLLKTPFDSRAVVDGNISSMLTEEEFFDYCYVQPMNEDDLQFIAEDENLDVTDSIIKISYLKNLIKSIRTNEQKFNDWLSDPTNHKIYTISGSAGTGKTTYINYRRHLDKKKWVILDLDFATASVPWFGSNKTKIYGDCSSASKKIYSIILIKISEMFFGTDADDKAEPDKICINFKNIINNYKKNIKNFYPENFELFDELSKIKITSKNTNNSVLKIAAILNNYFTLSEKEYSDSFFWEKALNILLILLRCKDDDKNEYAIVFDNLERFIANDEIYNEEINSVRRSLSSYIKPMCKKCHCHYGKFKILMAIRSSSARMATIEQHTSDELPSDMDISDWFVVDKIIIEKLRWYKNKKIEIDDASILLNIMGDIKHCKNELTGLKLFIDPLFNYNKRLIIDFVCKILEDSNYEEFINKYKELWGKDTQINRFAARSIVKGIVLQELDSVDNLFKELKLYAESDEGRVIGLGYCRKILTVLYNDDNKYVGLKQILSNVCGQRNIQKYLSMPEHQKDKEVISNILFYMNSYNRRENDWIQFIDIQIKNSVKSVKVKDQSELDSLIINNMDDIEIKITNAGKAYLEHIVASFEYFSFRYYKGGKYKPLFFAVPSELDLKNMKTVEDVECYRIISNVQSHAEKCINEMKRTTNINININIGEKKKGKYHHIRIIEQHQGYIDHFVKFLKENYNENDCKLLIAGCIKCRDKYNTLR